MAGGRVGGKVEPAAGHEMITQATPRRPDR
jgi:hypothetical protein